MENFRGGALKEISLYLHIPFCRKKCIYCDFYSVPYQREMGEVYIQVLMKQIKSLSLSFSTIYIGGGTPTVLEFSLLKRLLRSLREISKKVKEFTIEANPESLTREKIKLFLEEGVNRLSLGVQSLREEKLKKLGRIHSVAEAKKKLFLARNLGFKNINIDLIFGLWGETLKAWQEELKEATFLPLEHISSYALTYETHTPLFKMHKKRIIPPRKEETLAKMYAYTFDYLPQKGFLHYEVSNFSRAGYRCLHNLTYWNNNSYIGLGPSAVSYQEGIRKKNVSSLEDYIKRVNRGEDTFATEEELSSYKRAKETAALKIRTQEGILFDEFKKKTGYDFLTLETEAVKFLYQQGLIRKIYQGKKEIGISLTKKGFLFADSVCSELL